MLLELIQQDGLTPARKGPDEWSAPCPSCGGNDRFVVHPAAGRYWCRQCGAKGDVIQYLRDHRNMTFRRAAEHAGRPASSPAGQASPRTAQEARRSTPTPPPEAWVMQAEKLITAAHQSLVADPERVEWLRAKRGLTMETAQRFRLGWLPRDLYHDRAVWGLPAELREDGKAKKLFIPAGLTIPAPGRLRIRRSEPGEFGRYYMLPGSSNTPLVIGAEHPVESAGAIVVESELDSMLLHQEITGAVLIIAMGSTSNGPDETMVEDLTRRPFVLVALDSDKAGGRASWQKWMSTIPNATRAPIPAAWGTDPTDAFLAGHDLRQWFAMALRIAGHQAPPAPPTNTSLSAPTSPAPPAGPEVPAEVIGLPCGGCGATKYRRVPGGYTCPDGGQVAGWFCGSPDCGIKLLTGNKAVDRMARPEASR